MTEDRTVGRLVVARHDNEASRESPMGHWNARECGSRDSRRDAGNDFVGHAGSMQRERLFTAAAQHEGIARLQPHDASSAPRGTNEERIDGLLRERVPAGALPDIEPVGAPRDGEDLVGYEGVVEHQIGPAQPKHRAPRQQRRIAWTGADE